MTTVRAEIQKKLLAYKNAIVYAVELDYVDKMIPVDRSNKTKRFDQQLGDVVDDFKALTNEFETAGISVSQINREGAKSKKADGNINMTHIGGSWEKVENADIVLVLDVDEDMFEELGYVSVIIKNEKHRYSKEGSLIPTMFKPQYSKFYANPDAMRKMDAIDSTCGGNIADDALAHTLSIKAKKNKP
jgi:replicative DNA helicase